MSEIRNFKDLLAWQKAMDFVEECYRLTQSFPSHEKFGLAGQLQRAAVSVAANIAEGQGRATTGEFLNFLSIARGSLMEAQTHLLIAQRLGYVKNDDVKRVLDGAADTARLLNGLIRSLKQKSSSQPLPPRR